MDRRRTPGLSSLSTSRLSTHHYTTHGTHLRNQHSASLATQLSVFQSLLQNFATTHAKEIRADPAFRAEFARMCGVLGVDLLGTGYRESNDGLPDKDSGSSASPSSTKGRESSLRSLTALLPSLHLSTPPPLRAFYLDLAVLTIEICRATRAENGGYISLSDLQTHLATPRGPNLGLSVSANDIAQAVTLLEPLGSCFSVVTVGHATLLRSVPTELNADQATVLEAVQVCGYVSVSMLQENLGWGRARAVSVVRDLMASSLVWVDLQGGENEYWSPAFISGAGKG